MLKCLGTAETNLKYIQDKINPLKPSRNYMYHFLHESIGLTVDFVFVCVV